MLKQLEKGEFVETYYTGEINELNVYLERTEDYYKRAEWVMVIGGLALKRIRRGSKIVLNGKEHTHKRIDGTLRFIIENMK
jgi:hypothetical protein